MLEMWLLVYLEQVQDELSFGGSEVAPGRAGPLSLYQNDSLQ